MVLLIKQSAYTELLLRHGLLVGRVRLIEGIRRTELLLGHRILVSLLRCGLLLLLGKLCAGLTELGLLTGDIGQPASLIVHALHP